MTIKVSIDTFGGDTGALVTVAAGIEALQMFDDLYLIFVGDTHKIQVELDKFKSADSTRFEIIHASEEVLMNESPALALRKKKDSSMRVAINLLKEKRADACVSAGNTGALMAISRFVLKTIRGIDRPAIMGRIPTIRGNIHMLDLGANVESTPAMLLEFATMGSIAVQHTETNITNPSIGLLNIGEEEMKGNTKIKQTAALLRDSNLNYQGFIEGNDIYQGTVDLVVCDGFEGNIALKASEGVASMMGYYLKAAFRRNWLTKLVAIIATPVLKDFKMRLDPDKYNGASLLGLRGIVIKSHGGAGVAAFIAAIAEARTEAQAQVAEKIADAVAKELNKS